jgi:hypothetical protein
VSVQPAIVSLTSAHNAGDTVVIYIDREGAEYIADVMEKYQNGDAGAAKITREIRKELEE